MDPALEPTTTAEPTAEPTTESTDEPADDGAALTAIAVATVRARLLGADHQCPEPGSRWLLAPGASFVTLERRGRLRGCIGTLEASRPLYQDVIRNTTHAMVDPRLPPVAAADWTELDVKVSVLTAPEPVPVTSRAGLLAALRPGVDGLILEDSRRRATFLPAVWAKLDSPTAFLAALLAKGGWPEGLGERESWPAGLSVQRYASVEFHDPSPRPPLS